MNNFLFAEKVSVNKFLFAETVSVNNLFLTLMIMIICYSNVQNDNVTGAFLEKNENYNISFGV